MQVLAEQGRAPIKMWTDGVEVEEAAKAQLLNVASMPFIYKHVAVMPDVHWGIGATVGSVIPTKGAIIPAAVGVDIGCGMIAARLPYQAYELHDLAGLRRDIEAAVPVGNAMHTEAESMDAGLWGRLKEIQASHPMALPDFGRIERQVGTLGGGNHFIEVCVDKVGQVWVMLHSGSRGAGNRIGTYFIELAREDMRRHFINLPDRDLAYLPEGTQHFDDYWHAVAWAQDYARLNREQMLRLVLNAVARHLPAREHRWDGGEIIANCHHNYVARENHFGENILLTRKGAVSARPGQMGIIPGSMGARSYIVRGKGNAESFMSCSHGAGRRMSRGKAKETFTEAAHALATEGVECRKDAGVLDETPGAYKDIDAVIAAQKDLVEVVHVLKQIVCVKG